MICPPSEEKMNGAGPMPALDVTTKSPVGLNTWPVGAEPAGGRVTVRPAFDAVAPLGLTLYTVATLVPLSATHSGLVGLRARPQGFCRWGSTTCAPWSLRLEIRLVWWNSLCGPEASADVPGTATATATT